MFEVFQVLVVAVTALLALVLAIGMLALRNALLLFWISWWLLGVNWNKAWPALARGGWVVVVLFTVVSALVWSAIFPSTYDFFGFFTVGNFWWQLGGVTMVVLSALFCGWLQTVLGCTPSEIDLDPPAHADHAH